MGRSDPPHFFVHEVNARAVHVPAESRFPSSAPMLQGFDTALTWNSCRIALESWRSRSVLCWIAIITQRVATCTRIPVPMSGIAPAPLKWCILELVT